MANGTYLPGPLPSTSRIPHDAGYNGLLECPCSDRIPFEWGITYAIDDTDNHDPKNKNKCKECFTAVQQVIKAEKYDTQDISMYHYLLVVLALLMKKVRSELSGTSLLMLSSMAAVSKWRH